MQSPAHVRALDPELRVALLLAAGQRVEDVVGALRRLGLVGAEHLPDEPADRLDSGLPDPRDLVVLVAVVPVDGLDPVVGDPALVLAEWNLPVGGLGDAGLIPDAGPIDVGRHRPLVAGRTGEDECLMALGVERIAEVAGDERLAAVEPLGDQTYAHVSSASRPGTCVRWRTAAAPRSRPPPRASPCGGAGSSAPPVGRRWPITPPPRSPARPAAPRRPTRTRRRPRATSRSSTCRASRDPADAWSGRGCRSGSRPPGLRGCRRLRSSPAISVSRSAARSW